MIIYIGNLMESSTIKLPEYVKVDHSWVMRAVMELWITVELRMSWGNLQWSSEQISNMWSMNHSWKMMVHLTTG